MGCEGSRSTETTGNERTKNKNVVSSADSSSGRDSSEIGSKIKKNMSENRGKEYLHVISY